MNFWPKLLALLHCSAHHRRLRHDMWNTNQYWPLSKKPLVLLRLWRLCSGREENAHNFSLLTMWDQIRKRMTINENCLGPKITFFSFLRFHPTWCNALPQVESSCVAVGRNWCGHPNVLVLHRWNVRLFHILVFNISCCKINTIIHHFLLIFWLMISETQNVHRVCA